MSNSNYSIGLQRLKPVHTAYCGLHNFAENWSWARDVNGPDRDETLVRLETSRPRPQVCNLDTTVNYFAFAEATVRVYPTFETLNL